MSTAPEYDKITVWKRTLEKYKDVPERESIVIDEFFPYPLTYTPTIEFVKEDCVDVALSLYQEKPLLLNMADWEIAGGCVDVGAITQEEELFRRSDYHKSLLQSYYPMPRLRTILSKDVEFYCSGMKDGYIPYETPIKIDCVAAPAIRFPNLDRGRGYKMMSEPEDEKLMEEKIKILFYAASVNKSETLILSAWGCGAFGCPADHIAEIFKQVISKGVPVKKIVFAILGSNYEAFKESYEGSAV